MDPFTHALSGTLIAHAAAPGAGARRPGWRARSAAGALAALFPDCDFALRLVDTLFYLNWHQGLTHSLVLAPFWAWLLALAFSRFSRGRDSWRDYYLPALLGLLIHIAGDLITAYGTMLFAPFSTRRYALGYTFVVDPYLGVLLMAALAAAALTRWKRHAAVIGLGAALVYVAFAAGVKREALELGWRQAKASGWSASQVEALPQPLSPHHWKVIVREGDTFHEALARLDGKPILRLPGRSMLAALSRGYSSPAELQWARRERFGTTPRDKALAEAAWNAPALEPFRRFAKFAVVQQVQPTGGRACVSFVDLRFTLPAFPPSFVFKACETGTPGQWALERVRGRFWID